MIEHLTEYLTMNNIGLEVVFWTALSLYLLAKLGVFKKWNTFFTTKILNNKALFNPYKSWEIFFVIENMTFNVIKILDVHLII